MTDQLDIAAIRVQMDALSGFAQGPWKVSPTDYTTVITHDRNIVAEIDGDYNEPDLWPVVESSARLIAASPDMRATILALCDALDDARQCVSHANLHADCAIADMTALRACVTHAMGDVHDLLGVATDDEVDAIIAAWGRLNRPMPDTDAQVIEKLRAENDRLRASLSDVLGCDHHNFCDGEPPKYVRIARAALAQKGGEK